MPLGSACTGLRALLDSLLLGRSQLGRYAARGTLTYINVIVCFRSGRPSDPRQRATGICCGKRMPDVPRSMEFTALSFMGWSVSI